MACFRHNEPHYWLPMCHELRSCIEWWRRHTKQPPMAPPSHSKRTWSAERMWKMASTRYNFCVRTIRENFENWICVMKFFRVIPFLEHHNWITFQIAHIETFALLFDIRMLFDHQPSHMSEKETSGIWMRISIRFCILVMHPVFAKKDTNYTLILIHCSLRWRTDDRGPIHRYSSDMPCCSTSSEWIEVAMSLCMLDVPRVDGRQLLPQMCWAQPTHMLIHKNNHSRLESIINRIDTFLNTQNECSYFRLQREHQINAIQ